MSLASDQACGREHQGVGREPNDHGSWFWARLVTSSPLHDNKALTSSAYLPTRHDIPHPASPFPFPENAPNTERISANTTNT